MQACAVRQTVLKCFQPPPTVSHNTLLWCCWIIDKPIQIIQTRAGEVEKKNKPSSYRKSDVKSSYFQTGLEIYFCIGSSPHWNSMSHLWCSQSDQTGHKIKWTTFLSSNIKLNSLNLTLSSLCDTFHLIHSWEIIASISAPFQKCCTHAPPDRNVFYRQIKC